MDLPAGDDVLDFRDRAILKTYLYTGVRLATACRLRVRDFHQDGDEATLTICQCRINLSLFPRNKMSLV